MRVPAPYNLRIGTDIQCQSRLLASFSKPRYLKGLTARLLHPIEIAQAPVPLNVAFEKLDTAHDRGRLLRFLSGRWAAKEAAKKAWGASLLSFRDLRVESETDGSVKMICRPYHDETKGDAPSPTFDIEQEAGVSISHDGDYTIAVCLASPLHPEISQELGRLKSEAEAAVNSHKHDGKSDERSNKIISRKSSIKVRYHSSKPKKP